MTERLGLNMAIHVGFGEKVIIQKKKKPLLWGLIFVFFSPQNFRENIEQILQGFGIEGCLFVFQSETTSQCGINFLLRKGKQPKQNMFKTYQINLQQAIISESHAVTVSEMLKGFHQFRSNTISRNDK